jgi:hypothetical protein
MVLLSEQSLYTLPRTGPVAWKIREQQDLPNKSRSKTLPTKLISTGVILSLLLLISTMPVQIYRNRLVILFV